MGKRLLVEELARHRGRVIRILDHAKHRVLCVFRALPQGGGRIEPIDKKMLGKELGVPAHASGAAIAARAVIDAVGLMAVGARAPSSTRAAFRYGGVGRILRTGVARVGVSASAARSTRLAR